MLAQLCEWAGKPWPSTYMVATPSGGWHLYYAAPEGSKIRNSASLLGPLVDVRARGGYVVAAGSTVGGKRYEVLDAEGPEPLPGWIHRLLTRRPEADHGPAAQVRPAASPAGSGASCTPWRPLRSAGGTALFWAATAPGKWQPPARTALTRRCSSGRRRGRAARGRRRRQDDPSAMGGDAR